MIKIRIEKNTDPNYIFVKFPTQINNPNLEINNKNAIDSFKIKRCIISYFVYLNNSEFELFSNNLLSSYNWLTNKSDIKLYNSDIKYEPVYKIINIDSSYSIFVNPQNTSYAKKVGYIYPTTN